jgi:putative spermidine/putrescine transport system permease protein
VGWSGKLSLQRNETRALAWNLARSQRAATLRALLLLLPLVVFLLLVFIVPVLTFLSRSVVDHEVQRALPSTTLVLQNWKPGHPVPDPAYAALMADFKRMKSGSDVAAAATRLNYSLPGMRTLIMGTSSTLMRRSSQGSENPATTLDPRSVLAAISPKWNNVETWATIKQAGGPLTDFYFLSSFDLRRTPGGAVERAPASERAFLQAVERTFEIAAGVTLLAIMFGFPFAYLMATSSERIARMLMIVVLLPFWTAIMVRVLSWLVLLGREGIINNTLEGAGLINGPLDILYGRSSVYVALVHIFVPYMVLPLYSVMKTIPQSHLRAAASLGAPPRVVFRRVYLPQVMPGLAAGALLVFIQCLGVFVVPAILGGPDEQGLPMLITFYVNKTLNWGLAAALAVVLLISVYIFYWLFVALTKSAKLSVG